MSEDNYDDENVDYNDNDNDDNDYEMENDDLKEELENLFLNAKNSDDPISAYKSVIELEASNSNEKSMTIRSYKEICIIYLLRDDYKNFCLEMDNLMKASKSLKEQLFKDRLFDEILKEIKQNEDNDYSNYLSKMALLAEQNMYYGLSQELENFMNSNEKYTGLITKKKPEFSFNKIFEEYFKLKENYKLNVYNIDSLSEKEKLIPVYESKTINQQIPLIKESLKKWKNKEAQKFWSEWVDDYEKFSDLPIFYAKMIKTETCKIIGFNILIGLYDNKDSIEAIGFKASMFLFDILAQIFCDYDNPDVREYTVTSGLFSYILKRLQVLTEEIPRKFSPGDDNKTKHEEKKNINIVTQSKKTKGVGYSAYNYNEKEWDIQAFLEKQERHRNFLIESIISFFAKFFKILDLDPNILITIRNLILESALLPCIENLFIENNAVQLENNSKLILLYFEIILSFSESNVLYILLKDISKDYKPIQVKSIYDLVKDLMKTISSYKTHLKNLNKNSSFLEDILVLFEKLENNLKKFEQKDDLYEKTIKILDIQKIEPEKAYPLLLKKQAFDYISLSGFNFKSGDPYGYMPIFGTKKNNKTEESSNPEVASQEKILRLIGEYSNLQNSLPIEFTNSIFARADKDNIDKMVAIIFGSEGTPYSSGAFIYEIKFGDNYPNNPPHVEIVSTGNGEVRFNPNLYNTGKVCLSLLGTWRGTQGESWNPKISTIYQVLLSIQSIIMSEFVYFNEPGYESKLGTSEGDQLNEGYSNIVRYNNIRVCMINMIKT